MSIFIVTGAAGFIGSNLVQTLLNRGETVIGVDEFNDYYDPNLKRKNIAEFEKYPGFKLVEGDILSLNWQSLLSDAKVIFHQAAQAGVRASWGDGFRSYTERNINSTQVLLEAAKKAPNLQKFVYASSSSIYGNAESFPTSENACPQPVSPYGITKLAGERLCGLYYQNFGIPTTSLRYFTVYGPRQRPDMAFHKFFKSILLDQPISIFGDGLQTRDFTFISDCVAANLAAAEVTEAAGEVFNIGGGSRVILKEVIDTIEQIVDRPIRISFTEAARGDARHTSADVTKAKKILGYQPQVSLEAGLRQEWEWIQSLYS
ncbi:MAG: NAD-dependent epimerase/dehydratase family protein [Tychonema bourrellyi B0820]|uniref:UDP-glucose 4-epimerase n=1 Tax=Tychonema bourrellyi FEM_GT703 TaxID=2040638 RepID=A0A2G4EVN0_9CYAN|nr:NAD-dependent epimerase/dehydratase family protein [Tychonema bourrellyi]MDQ2098068.1 NAD-dependent epimerase/dehydratase family protein [Tychonema bourrellyi B0820]PHX53602.1 UDP-glucose 4-epimerase [Tychonema bourrellyi FEM_GT703]